MTFPVLGIFITTGLGLLLTLLTVIGVKRQRARQGLKPPIEFQLTRLPGETLRVREQTLMDDILIWLFMGAAVVILISISPFWIQRWLPSANPEILTLTASALFVAGCAVILTRAVRLTQEMHKARLGCAGERHVGEKLQDLHVHGYKVFHDLPFTLNGKTQNLDHVAVGPHGLLVVETKTRSQSTHGRPGSAEVTFDGERLIWPNCGNDRAPLYQIERGASWLAKWIREQCELEIPVQKMIAIPGWTVKPGKTYNPRVVSGDAIVSAFTSLHEGQPPVLNPSQLRKVIAKLNQLVRTDKW